MIMPKNIADKMREVNKLMSEIDRWMYENIVTEGSKHQNKDVHGNYVHKDYYKFTDEPLGDEQDDGEYCDQYQIGEDSFRGDYYVKTEDGDYFTFDYWV